MNGQVQCGYQKFQLPHQDKFYRAYISNRGETQFSEEKFKRATDASLHATDWKEKIENMPRIEYSFDLKYALESGELGEVSKHQVDAIALSSIQYAKSSIETASAATLLEALVLEVKNEKPRKTLLKMLVSKINKHEAMVLNEYSVTLK